MDLQWSPADLAFRDEVREWLAENHPGEPPAGGEDAQFEFARQWQRTLHEAGWAGISWPREYGGRGATLIEQAIFQEEMARAKAPRPANVLGLVMGGPVVIAHGTEEQKERFLEPILSAEEIWCQGFSEPEAGSDLASLRTRATRDGDRWILNGQKIWTSRGHIARRILLLARTGTPESRHRGLSMFLVDLQTPGITVRPIPCADGREALSEVFFSDAAIPADALVGEVDGGWAVAMYLLQFERGNFAWQRQAWLRSRLVAALNEPDADADAAAEAVGEAYLNLLALRATSLDTLRRLVAGEQLGPAISVVKVLLSTTDKAVLDAARALMWPRLEIGDEPGTGVWRQEWWFSRMASVLGGTVEVQRDIIANRVLALPKE